jgi:hypothetical protein
VGISAILNLNGVHTNILAVDSAEGYTQVDLIAWQFENLYFFC